MFLDDAYIIDSYNRKVLKVSNDISTELFNLEKEDIVTENKDVISIDDYTKNLIKKYLKITDTEIEKIILLRRKNVLAIHLSWYLKIKLVCLLLIELLTIYTIIKKMQSVENFLYFKRSV